MRSQAQEKREMVVSSTLGNAHCRSFMDRVFGDEVSPNKLVTDELLSWWDRAREKYRSSTSSYRVSKRDYQSLLEELSEYENRLTAGEHEAEAKHIVELVREWLELAIAYRIAQPYKGKCLVY